jgi:hypothetical protein
MNTSTKAKTTSARPSETAYCDTHQLADRSGLPSAAAVVPTLCR